MLLKPLVGRHLASRWTRRSALSMNLLPMYNVYAGESVQLNTARFDVYKRCKSFRELPPSEDALRLHVKRSAFQAGWIWGNTFSQSQVPSIFDFGWKKDAMGKLVINWAPPINKQLLKDFTTTCKHAKSTL